MVVGPGVIAVKRLYPAHGWRVLPHSATGALFFDGHGLGNGVCVLLNVAEGLVFGVQVFFFDVFAILNGVRGLFFIVRGLSNGENELSDDVKEFSDEEKESLIGV